MVALMTCFLLFFPHPPSLRCAPAQPDAFVGLWLWLLRRHASYRHTMANATLRERERTSIQPTNQDFFRFEQGIDKYIILLILYAWT